MTHPDRIWATPARGICWSSDTTRGVPVRGYGPYLRQDGPTLDEARAALVRARDYIAGPMADRSGPVLRQIDAALAKMDGGGDG